MPRSPSSKSPPGDAKIPAAVAKKGGPTAFPVSSAQLGSAEDGEAWIDNSAREDTRARPAGEADRAAVEAARVARERLLAEVSALPAMPGVYRYFDVAGTVAALERAGIAAIMRRRVSRFLR